MPDTSVGRPEGIVLLTDGRLAICDTHYHRVVFFSVEGKFLGSFGKLGRQTGEFVYPVAITQDDKGFIYIAEYGGNDRIQRFSQAGVFQSKFSSFGTGEGQLQRPSGLVWHDGTIYVADAINNRVSSFTDKGTYLGVLGGTELDLKFPYDIALDPGGALCIIEYGAGRLTRVNLKGVIIDRYGSAGNGPQQFRTPWGLMVDKNRRIIVADTGNRRLVTLKQ